MEQKMILLVEDNPDDEALTLRALKKNNIGNDLCCRTGWGGSARLFILQRRLCRA